MEKEEDIEAIEEIIVHEQESMIAFDDKYQDKYFWGSNAIQISFAIKINEIIRKINGGD